MIEKIDFGPFCMEKIYVQDRLITKKIGLFPIFFVIIKLPTLELYNNIIDTIIEATQVYYNMRLALGLECG